MADIDIHCNVIKCRKPLSIEQKACVTSCSHIFCMDCSNRIFSKSLLCPACNTTLSQESEDIMITQLNPKEEYKSFVLAGLKPDIILDVCSRAISFYEYQTSQELAFKSILQKNTQDKYNSIKSRFDLVARDINHIIKVEKEKREAIVNDYELEKKKSQQIYKKFEEKSRQFQKLKIMYEKLKRKSIAPNIQESFHNAAHQQPPGHSNMNDDIVSTFTAATPSVFIPPNRTHQQPQQRPPWPTSSSRIPSPVKSIYSIRSHQQRFYKRDHHMPAVAAAAAPPSEP